MRWLRRSQLAPLDLNYLPSRGRQQWVGLVLLLVAVLFTADVVWSYVHVRGQIAARMNEIAAMPATISPAETHSRTYKPENMQRELEFAHAAIASMSLPWNDLFKALNSANTEDVALLSVVPDPEAGTVAIEAEAKNFAAMLTYVARIENTGYLRSLSLVRHEIKTSEPRRPILFSISAGWRSRS